MTLGGRLPLRIITSNMTTIGDLLFIYKPGWVIIVGPGYVRRISNGWYDDVEL